MDKVTLSGSLQIQTRPLTITEGRRLGIQLHKSIPECNRVYQVYQSVLAYQSILKCTKVYQSVLGSTKVYQSVLMCTKVYQIVIG